MMFGLIGASIVSGQLMVRIKRYHYLGTVGMVISGLGMYFLSQVSIHSTPFQVTASLVMVGIGLGVSFPLYITALQSAVDRKYLGVVSSNTQFWRNVGGTIATAVFGSILAAELPGNIKAEVTRLNLPPQLLKALSSFGNANPQQIFNNTAGIPAPVLDAIRTGLAGEALFDHLDEAGVRREERFHRRAIDAVQQEHVVGERFQLRRLIRRLYIYRLNQPQSVQERDMHHPCTHHPPVCRAAFVRGGRRSRRGGPTWAALT